MTRYTLLDPITGDASMVAVSELTQQLRVNHILLRGEEPIGIITHRDVVFFCRWCLEKTLAQRQTVPSVPSKVYPEAYTAVGLVDKWLEDPDSVSSEELKQASDAAWSVGPGPAGCGWAAASAADAASVAADADGAAAVAARSADRAEVSFEAQAQWFVEHLKSNQ